MVLIDSQKRVPGLSGGQPALQAARGTASLAALASVFFNLCEACISKVMASIPPSAFSASRIRESQQGMKVIKGNEPPPKYFNTKYMELSPLKYNSKLMNSIWGFYNRYSPHNVKKVSEANSSSGEMQQSAAVSSSKNEPVLSLPTQLDNVWAAINVSQSH